MHRPTCRLFLVFCITLGVTGLIAPAAHAASPVADPTLTLPPAGLRSHPLWDSYYELAPFGYEEQEYFVSGTATSGAAAAPYTTRVIVTRPSQPSRFNGTVLLDWVNVTSQFENAVDTMEARQMLMREGFAFVHVSAQAIGICCTPLTPKVWDPVRYAALSHPGDEYAADMFSQVAKAFRAPRLGEDPMRGLHVERVLAAGQSQSAIRLYGYVNTTQAAAQVIDGFLIHSGGEKTFAAPLTTKVLHLLSDLEADPAAPNPSERNYRLWEIAGAAHSDFFIGYQSEFGLGPRTLADAPPLTKAEFDALIEVAGNYGEQVHPMLATCTLAGATMPMRYATSTAIHLLDAWVRTGQAPQNGPRYAFTGPVLASDDLGNTLGGIRLPPAVVPVARYRSTACGVGGLTVPLTDAEIQARYATHAEYYRLMAKATDASVSGGWLLPVDAVDQMRRACGARNRWGDTSAGACEPYVSPAFNVQPSVVAAPAVAPRPTAPTLPATGGEVPIGAAWMVAVGALVIRLLRSRYD